MSSNASEMMEKYWKLLFITYFETAAVAAAAESEDEFAAGSR